MAVKNLELRAKVIVEGFWNGLHRSPFHGFSVEFSEYRQYSPGDDPRYLDWKLYARSDRYYIKKFEDETNLRCHLLVDQSRSMEYGSRDYTKYHYANTLAATLGYFLFQQGDAVGLLSFADKINDFLPARNRSGHLRRIMLALEKPPSGASTDLESPLQRIVELVRRRGLVVLISDLLAPIEALENRLRLLRACGHEVQVFQLLDPAERRFTFDQANFFQDVESGKEVYVDPNQARKGYLERLEKHLATVESICNKNGIGYHFLTTEQPLELQLFDFLKARMSRSKVIAR
ncbi:MAG: hypothetical protein M2R46_00716 [Verrucomicrobia subdivision 3 bacterium]|nr:hypothetical protein [Limisphaerales bacterium]